MAGETDNLVLEHLRLMRAQLSALDHKVDDVLVRLSALEGHFASFHLTETRQSHEIDRLKDRVERIERRLDLVDPAR